MKREKGKVYFLLKEGNGHLDKGVPVFYQIDPESWKVNSITQNEYETISAPPTTTILPWKKLLHPTEIVTADKTVFHPEYTHCKDMEEGDPICSENYLIYQDKKIKLQESEGRTVLFAEKWNNQVWLGYGYEGEYGWEGRGFQVYDLASGKKVFGYAEPIMGGILPSLFMIDSQRNWMWVGTSAGLLVFDKSFKLIHYCHLSVPDMHGGKYNFDCITQEKQKK